MSESIEAVSAWLLLAEENAGWSGLFSGPCGQFMPFFLGMAVLAYFFLFRPERQERLRKEQLRRDLKKNDRVVTIGGVLGTVASVSPDSNEVTLKIDEASGAKMRVLRSAIHEVIRDEGKKDEPRKDEFKKDEPKDDGSPK